MISFRPVLAAAVAMAIGVIAVSAIADERGHDQRGGRNARPPERHAMAHRDRDRDRRQPDYGYGRRPYGVAPPPVVYSPPPGPPGLSFLFNFR